MRLDPPIPLHVSGFGPRAMALAGEHGDGVIFAIPPRGVPLAEALAHARQGAARRNRSLDGFRDASLSSVFVLEKGEAADSDRVKAAIGPNVMASVYYFHDTVHERGIDPPPFLSRIWGPCCKLIEQAPPGPGAGSAGMPGNRRTENPDRLVTPTVPHLSTKSIPYGRG